MLDTLFHALVRWAAPVLVFTSEEVWSTRYPGEGSVHLLEWPLIDTEWREDASLELEKAGPVALALSNALVLTVRFAAVVAFVLDRRLAKRNPFDDPGVEPEVRQMTDAERRFLDQLWRDHRVLVEVRRQDPFGWA